MPRTLILVALVLALAAGTSPGASASVALPWPSEADRIRGWQEDLDSTLTAWLPRDRSFSADARARVQAGIQTLRASVPALTDEQIVVRLAAAVAGAGNAHTRLYLLRNRGVLRRYPIRIWWFGDELDIVRARPEYEAVAGGRILTLAGQSPARVAERVAPLYAANPSWSRYMSTYLLTSPEILQGAGIIVGDTLEITVETRDKQRRTVRLAPMALERLDQPTEAWWDLAPSHPGRQGPWASALPEDSTRLPLYLQRLSRWYWTNRIPGQDVLYLQYNRSQDQPGQETVAEFGRRVLAELQRQPPRKLVLDLRFNTGGNLELADSLIRAIAAHPLSQERGRLFVITGRATFSAGITAVATLRELTRAVIVGEPVGDKLEMWSEGGNVMLPNTKLTLHYTNGFHSYTPREYPDRKPYRYPDLSVNEVGPDIPVVTTLTQYLAGKDPALEAILEYRPPR